MWPSNSDSLASGRLHLGSRSCKCEYYLLGGWVIISGYLVVFPMLHVGGVLDCAWWDIVSKGDLAFLAARVIFVAFVCGEVGSRV